MGGIPYGRDTSTRRKRARRTDDGPGGNREPSNQRGRLVPAQRRNPIRRFLYEPSILGRQQMAIVFGSRHLNISDIRDLMRDLDELDFVKEARDAAASAPLDAGGNRPLEHVQLQTLARAYTVNELANVGLSEFDEYSLSIPRVVRGFPAPINITLGKTRRACITSGATGLLEWVEDVAAVVERVFDSIEERPIGMKAQRDIGAAALAGALGVVYLWFVLAAHPAVANSVLTATLGALVYWLVASRIRADIPIDFWGYPPGVSPLISTPREVMDQRRHDNRLNRRTIFWTLAFSIPLSGIVGAILTLRAGRP